MDGSVGEPERANRCASCVDERLLGRLVFARRRDVNRLFENGPSSGSGLSKIANTRSSPAVTSPSRANSRPSIKLSTWMYRCCSSRIMAMSALSSKARIRTNASSNSAALLARITPRLADSPSGFSTHGNGMRPVASSGFALAGTRKNFGTGRPAASNRWRDRYLSWHASTEAGEWYRTPSDSAASDATRVGRSATATMASKGPAPINTSREA